MLTKCFVTKMALFRKKHRVATQRVQTRQATCTLLPACQDGGVFIEGKRKLRKGEVRTIKIYYKHRVLPVEFSRVGVSQLCDLRTSISPTSSHRSSQLIVFA